ncbi:MAG: molybdopterin-guanine dinucleotide biosynthesis protein B [Azonexus sp.]
MRVFGFAGYSGAGKTSLIEKIIPILVGRGLRVSLIKHAHHVFDVDTPGKDTYRHRQAGCSEVLIVSNQRWALMHESRDEPAPEFEQQLQLLSPCDVVLVEGYKSLPFPKLEVWREANQKPWLDPTDPHIVGVAADVGVPAEIAGQRPCLALNDPAGIADFILRYLELDDFCQTAGKIDEETKERA